MAETDTLWLPEKIIRIDL